MGEQELLGFIRAAVRSVWALELLLAMRRSPDRRWTVDALVQELRGSTMVVREALDGFVSAGLVTSDGGGFSYAPASPVLAEFAETLEQTYRERPVWVVNAIASRRDKLQSFADAFRLKDDSQ